MGKLTTKKQQQQNNNKELVFMLLILLNMWVTHKIKAYFLVFCMVTSIDMTLIKKNSILHHADRIMKCQPSYGSSLSTVIIQTTKAQKVSLWF